MRNAQMRLPKVLALIRPLEKLENVYLDVITIEAFSVHIGVISDRF